MGLFRRKIKDGIEGTAHVTGAGGVVDPTDPQHLEVDVKHIPKTSELHRIGVLTDDEFAREKARILADGSG